VDASNPDELLIRTIPRALYGLPLILEHSLIYDMSLGKQDHEHSGGARASIPTGLADLWDYD
jgi:hypothetical protein